MNVLRTLKPTYHLGLDLGKANDAAVLTTTRRVTELVAESWRANPHEQLREYQVCDIQRWPLGTSYVTIARGVVAHMARPEIGGCEIAVDYGGVGQATADILREEGIRRCTWVTTTGGENINWRGRMVSVPKRELVSTLLSLFHKQQIRTNPDLPYVDLLRQEINDFDLRINARGHIGFEGSGGSHDDMVMSLALSVWAAENRRPAFGAALLDI